MTDLVRNRLIHLHHCRGIGWKTLDAMLKHDPTLNKIYSYSPKDLHIHFRLPAGVAEQTYHDLHDNPLEHLLHLYQTHHIRVITIFDNEYPFLLKQIYQPPFVLYCLGDVRLLAEKRMLSVVGTRNPSGYGLRVTEDLIGQLMKYGYVIVSGFAKGIDGEAHLQTDRFGGKTVAVLGSGFFHIYPKEHRLLFEKMERDHLLISEYPPDKKPQKHHFPERNRIIAGLSLGTLVVEAKEKSGSLITANYALQEGREVFAVPGPITSPTSRGTNLLIQEGAKLILSAEDIHRELKYSVQ